MPQRPPLKPLRLSIFFPCHNEEAHVEPVTHAALRVAKTVAETFEVIIVNDGSTDRTAALADQLASAHPEVRVVHLDPNQGYGGALRAGFAAATLDWVFYTDGDQQFDLDDLPRLLERLSDAEIVSAYRQRRAEGWQRRLNAAGWGFLIRLLFGLRLRDIDCAFKVYPRALFDEIELRSTGALIDAEVLIQAQQLGYRIAQLPVRHLPRQAGDSSGANLSVILRALREVIALYRRLKRAGRSRAAG